LFCERKIGNSESTFRYMGAENLKIDEAYFGSTGAVQRHSH